MINYICLAFRYNNQSKDYSEALAIAKKAAVKSEITDNGSTKYTLSDGSAMIDTGSSVNADENRWWNK